MSELSDVVEALRTDHEGFALNGIVCPDGPFHSVSTTHRYGGKHEVRLPSAVTLIGPQGTTVYAPVWFFRIDDCHQAFVVFSGQEDVYWLRTQDDSLLEACVNLGISPSIVKAYRDVA